MRTNQLLVTTLLGLLACSSPSAGEPTPAASMALAPAAAPAAAPSVAPSHGEDEDLTVPAEAFSDPQRAFDRALTLLRSRYYAAGLTDEDLYRAAVAGMVRYVDPSMRQWNKLLSPRQYADLATDLSGQLVGIGVKIKFDPATGHSVVLGTIAGSPAEKEGLRASDTILSVNGKLFKERAERDVVAEIRGKAGEAVTLGVLRDDKILTLSIVRAPIVLDDVSHAVYDGVGYVSIRAFSARTPPAVKAAMEDLAASKVRALAVDVRENMGGSFDEAIRVAEQFVPAGAPIVGLRRRDGREEVTSSKGAPVLATVPVVVLVDHGTASSAELLAGALAEERRARTVGTRTFGKWSVQAVEELGNGYAIKFTTAAFHTPGGHTYEGIGLVPDVEVDQPAEAVERSLHASDPSTRPALDPQLRTALSLLAPG